MLVETDIGSLPGTSAVTIKHLRELGIETYGDLLNYIPFRYEDYSLATPIATLQEGETVSVRGIITDTKNQYTRSRLTIQKAVIQDKSGGTISITWYNQPYLLRVLRIGMEIAVSGEVTRFNGKLSMAPSEWEPVKPDMIHTGRIVPVYSETRGLSSHTIREKTYRLLEMLKGLPEPAESLPQAILSGHRLLPLPQALRQIHFPLNIDELQAARRRLGFDELLLIQTLSQMTRRKWKDKKVKHVFSISNDISGKLQEFIAGLPFTLTGDQMKSIREILADLDTEVPMNRFLQGDVGSGKTVVAAAAAYVAYLNGFQTLFMAPTEILAKQHYQTLQKLFSKTKINIAIQTGSKKTIRKDTVFDIAVGTQALLASSLQFERIGLVVIDEQHRFGVAQRALLKEKGGEPHLLTMTATPIPRTLALALYGELDVSSIHEMPSGRLPIKSFLVPQAKRDAAYEWIRNKIRTEKSQVFIICPLIEESGSETLQSVKAAKIEYERLKSAIFPECTVDLLHGKLPAKEKDRIMEGFSNGTTDILVSTSVVEVGIDIPNASIMIIEGAEHYGMAQLHQLRGRVGRGSTQSYCYLFSDSQEEEVISRLSFFAHNLQGEKLAEYDLHRRGPGNIFGTRQHGFLKLKIASLSDISFILEAKSAAESLLKDSPDLSKYPVLKEQVEHFTEETSTAD